MSKTWRKAKVLRIRDWKGWKTKKRSQRKREKKGDIEKGRGGKQGSIERGGGGGGGGIVSSRETRRGDLFRI